MPSSALHECDYIPPPVTKENCEELSDCYDIFLAIIDLSKAHTPEVRAELYPQLRDALHTHDFVYAINRGYNQSQGSTFTDSLGDFAPNESFSMYVDEIVPSPKRAVGRTPSTVGSPLPVVLQPLPQILASSEKIPQSTHVRPPVVPPISLRCPPPLGMRRLHNLPNAGFPSSQPRYATTQLHYAASRAK
ncbi:hypothetical protein DFH29DRAFT_1082669 [Suillus ampliporus]|nr:hypothetical protein DFH29DRAFT_1082669 [Suillus ampliporus]